MVSNGLFKALKEKGYALKSASNNRLEISRLGESQLFMRFEGTLDEIEKDIDTYLRLPKRLQDLKALEIQEELLQEPLSTFLSESFKEGLFSNRTWKVIYHMEDIALKLEFTPSDLRIFPNAFLKPKRWLPSEFQIGNLKGSFHPNHIKLSFEGLEAFKGFLAAYKPSKVILEPLEIQTQFEKDLEYYDYCYSYASKPWKELKAKELRWKEFLHFMENEYGKQ